MTHATIPPAGKGRQTARSRTVKQLREWMATGVLVAGDTLPSERELCGRLDVSLGTVQRAIRVLEDQGVIVRHGLRTRTVSAEKVASGLLHGTILVIADWKDTYRLNRTTGSGAFITAGILESLSDDGIPVTLFPPQHINSPRWDTLVRQAPTGVIASEIASAEKYSPLGALMKARELGVPCVACGDEPEYALFDRVVPDHEQGAYELTRWLLQKGRRRIRQMWNVSVKANWVECRRRGYERAMKEGGLKPLPPVTAHVGDRPELTEEEQFRAHVESNVGALYTVMQGEAAADALLVINDAYVGGVAAALRILGHEPNRDVWLAGYDDTWEDDLETHFEKTGPMVTMNRCTIETGRMLVQVLNERRNGKLQAGPVTRSIPPRMRILADKSV